jgi:stress response protein YsnF
VKDKILIPVVEEQATFSRQTKVTGRVKVQTATAVDQEMATIDLATEAVEVTRVSVGREVDDPPLIRTEGDLTIVPVIEERAIVRKQLVLVEEIHIRRSTSVENVAIPVTTRRQTVRIERSGGDDDPPAEME